MEAFCVSSRGETYFFSLQYKKKRAEDLNKPGLYLNQKSAMWHCAHKRMSLNLNLQNWNECIILRNTAIVQKVLVYSKHKINEPYHSCSFILHSSHWWQWSKCEAATENKMLKLSIHLIKFIRVLEYIFINYSYQFYFKILLKMTYTWRDTIFSSKAKVNNLIYLYLSPSKISKSPIAA